MDRFVSHDVFLCLYLLAFNAFFGRWEPTNNWKIDFLTSVADPDLGSGKFFPDPRSQIPDPIHISESNNFLGKKYFT